jgi:cell division protein FtsZ
MSDPTQIEPVANPPAKRTPVIKVFGIGSAGVNILEQLLSDGVTAASLIAVHSDGSRLEGCSAGEKVHIENKTARSLNTAKDPGCGGGLAAEEQLPRLKALCSGADVILIIAGLGGALGTGLSGVLAGAAHQAGAFVLAFVVLPFDCEGSLRSQLADAGLKRLKESADLVICWPNQKTLRLIDEATSLLDTFKASNRLLGNCVRGAWRALGSEAAMGLRFLELCSAIRNHSTECAFGVAETAGPNRATEAVERLLAHPMLAGPGGAPASDPVSAPGSTSESALPPTTALQQSQAVAVCVLGGPSLGMTEVNRIMEQLNRRCESAPVLMGAAITPELGDSLLVALLVAAPAEEPVSPSLSEEDEPDMEPTSRGKGDDFGVQLLDPASGTRRHSRFVPPAPSLPPEKMAQLLHQQGRGAGRARKGHSKLRQTQLPLEIVSKGRFVKSEPTIHKGEDLDVPTYIRRGVALN